MLRPFRYSWRILYNAVSHYFRDSGSAFASHVALSGLLALFPFLIFATSLASFVGARYANNVGKGDVLWVPGKNR